MSRRFDAERAFDRRRRQLLAQAGRHRRRATEHLSAAAAICSRDHPLLWLLAGVGLGATAVVALPAAVRAAGAASRSLLRIAGAGARLVAITQRGGA